MLTKYICYFSVTMQRLVFFLICSYASSSNFLAMLIDWRTAGSEFTTFKRWISLLFFVPKLSNMDCTLYKALSRIARENKIRHWRYLLELRSLYYIQYCHDCIKKFIVLMNSFWQKTILEYIVLVSSVREYIQNWKCLCCSEMGFPANFNWIEPASY